MSILLFDDLEEEEENQSISYWLLSLEGKKVLHLENKEKNEEEEENSLDQKEKKINSGMSLANVVSFFLVLLLLLLLVVWCGISLSKA